MLPDDSRASLLARIKQANGDSVALLLANPEKMLRLALRGKDLLSQRFFAEDFLQSFQDFLAAFKPFILPYDGLLKPVPFLDSSDRRLVASLPSAWELSRAETFANQWLNAVNVRVNSPLVVYRAKNLETESYLDFYIVNAESAHGLLFKVGSRFEGRFFAARKDFSAVINSLFSLGFRRITASVLTSPAEYPLQRSEWRTEQLQEHNCSKLMFFWRRMGAVASPTQADSIAFFHPEETREVKKTFETDGRPPPFKFLNRSIYALELERELRVCAKKEI